MLHRKLANGLEVVLKENHFSKMVALQCWVGAGSLHERQGEYGMAHCIEHMLFKGTSKHKVGEISSRIEAFGGDVNAYTTFDQTVFYLTLNAKHAFEGVSILADAIFNSSFDQEELAKEKEVILEEIRRSQDNPSHLLGRKVFEAIYQGTPAARPIIGYAESVEEFTRDDIIGFHKRWYQPNNLKVIAVGDFDARTMYEAVAEHFGTLCEQDSNVQKDAALTISDLRPAKPSQMKVEMLRGDYMQPRLEVAFAGPRQDSPEAIALDLAAFVLGSGESSRLTRRLRDQKQFVSAVAASTYNPKFGGLFEVSAVPEPEQFLQAAYEIGFELARLKLHEPVTPQEIARARVNLKADQMYQEETLAGQARSIGYSLHSRDKLAYDRVYAAKLDAIGAEDVRNALFHWIDLEKAMIFGILPASVSLNETAIQKAYLDGVAAGSRGKIDPFITMIAKDKAERDTGIFHREIKPGIDFVYRRNASCDLFNLTAVTQGGLQAENMDNSGLHHCFASLLASATEERSFEDFSDYIEGHGAVLGGFSGKDSLGLKLQCFSEEAREMVHLWADCLLRPRFPETQWRNTQMEIKDDIRAEEDSPSGVAIRMFQRLLYHQHPYSLPVYGSGKILDREDHFSLLSEFECRRDAGPWVIGGVGSWDAEDVYDLLSRCLDGFHPRTGSRSFPGSQIIVDKPKAATHFQMKDKEQTHIVVGTKGLDWFAKERATLDVLSTVLGGSGGRLFLKLRDQESLAYTVTPVSSYGCHAGVFAAYLACATDKVDQALQGIFREFLDLQARPVTDAELTRAKNYLLGSHESDMQRGDAQAMTMALMQLYGVGYDDFLKYPEAVESVTASDIQSLASTLLDPEHLLSVIVGRKAPS